MQVSFTDLSRFLEEKTIETGVFNPTSDDLEYLESIGGEDADRVMTEKGGALVSVSRKQLYVWRSDVVDMAAKFNAQTQTVTAEAVPAVAAPAASMPTSTAPGWTLTKAQPKETSEQRQAQRWRMCIDAGLKMPSDTFSHYPRGIGKIATSLKITRQSLIEDLNKYRERTMGR